MSGYQRPRNHSALSVKLPRLPFNFPGADIVNGAFTLLENADSQNVKKNLEAPFPAILMLAADGSTYRITLDNSNPAAPVLKFVQVPPL
jgi:hypothetical protein